LAEIAWLGGSGVADFRAILGGLLGRGWGGVLYLIGFFRGGLLASFWELQYRFFGIVAAWIWWIPENLSCDLADSINPCEGGQISS
jgi:hypothetical protein